MKFVQLIECTVEVKEHKAHDRSDVIRKEVRGLVGVAHDGSLYRYNYKDLGWDLWHDGSD